MTTRQKYMDGKVNSQLVDSLTKVLADSFVLYFKTHAFHWNVVGPNFRALHEMFEEQYSEIWASIDVTAERIRSLEAMAPINLDAMKARATLQETGQIPDAMAMVQQLANDNLEIVNTIYAALRVAQDAGDEATIDMLNARTRVHEQYAWMLNSLLK